MRNFRGFALAFVLLTMAGCLAGTSPSGGAPAPAVVPSLPSGMAGPDGAGGGTFVGEKDGDLAAVPEAATGDPTSGNETPMTIVGSPLGSSTKPRPCDGVGFRLCFHDVTVTPKGEGAYELAGIVATQTSVDAEPEGLLRQDVLLTDLLFPDNKAMTSSTKTDVAFRASINSVPGRGLRLESKYCRRITTLDLNLPDSGSGPLVIDACASPEPTDTYTPPKPGHLEALPLEVDGYLRSR